MFVEGVDLYPTASGLELYHLVVGLSPFALSYIYPLEPQYDQDISYLSWRVYC